MLKQFFRKAFNNGVTRNASWIIGEKVFQMLLSAIIGILSARYLGPSNYGILSYTASFVAFFTSFATLGMDGIIIKAMIAKPNLEGKYLGSCIGFRVFSSILSSISIVAIVAILNPGDNLRIILVFIQALQLVFQASHLLNSWFQRHLKSKHVSIANIFASIIVSVYRIFLLISSKDVIWFAFSGVITQIVIGIILYSSYKSENGQKLSFSLSTGKEVLSDSYHLILSGLMVVIYSQIDKIMIGQLMSDADVGYYTTALTICSMWTFLPIAIITSFQPVVLELKQAGDEAKYSLRLQQVYSTVIWISIFASVFIFIFAKFIILTLYGEQFSGAINILKVAIWFETFSIIGSARGIWVIAESQYKYVKYYLGFGALLNIVLNAVMIPLLGTVGAAIATLITQIFTSLIAPLFFRETRKHTTIVVKAFLLDWFFNRRRAHQP